MTNLISTSEMKRSKSKEYLNTYGVSWILKYGIPALSVLFHMALYAQDYRKFTEAQYKKPIYNPGDLSQHYCFIGMYREALSEEEKPEHKVNWELAANTAGLQAKNAYPYIYEAIQKNRIVILNEAHNKPVHRVLFYNLIDSLKACGVDAVFMEALGYNTHDSTFNYSDSFMNEGYYGSENVYRQVLLKLKRRGLKMYSYELSFNDLDTMTIQKEKYIVAKNDTKWFPIKADEYILSRFFSKDEFAERDMHQALKIYQKLERENIGKAFIYCGYSHAWRQGITMISNLEYLLKTTVFSIDQTLLNEHLDKTYESPVYARFAESDHPVVIVDRANKPVHTICSTVKDQSCSDKLVDMAIVSPKNVFIHNRPTWLELNGDRKWYPLTGFMELTQNVDFLVAVYKPRQLKIKENEDPVPEDVFQVFGNGKDYDLILQPNEEYEMRIIKDGKIILQKPISTKE